MRLVARGATSEGLQGPCKLKLAMTHKTASAGVPVGWVGGTPKRAWSTIFTRAGL